MAGRFDFTTIYDRSGTGAIAAEHIPIPGVKPREGVKPIPMWIADMNFATAPAVVQAVEDRLKHPLFGYFDVYEEYDRVIMDWHRRRHGVCDLKPEYIGYENGVLGGVTSALNAFTSVGEAILLHSPAYVGFTEILKNNGRRVIHSPLKKDEQGIWRMDFADMDRKIKENHIRFAIFCSPQNPCGRVWERWEIERAMEVYERNHCIVVSDEIWSDLVLDGHQHIPTQTVSEYARNHTLAFYAITKTFNLAGFVGSYHVVRDGYLRDRLKAASEPCTYNHANVLSVAALMGAYSSEGEAWLEELKEVLSDNAATAADFLNNELPGVCVSRAQGTYMLFVDVSGYLKSHPETDMDALLRRGVEAGVIWQDGRTFFWPDSIRLNLALPKSMLEEALRRMKEEIFI